MCAIDAYSVIIHTYLYSTLYYSLSPEALVSNLVTDLVILLGVNRCDLVILKKILTKKLTT